PHSAQTRTLPPFAGTVPRKSVARTSDLVATGASFAIGGLLSGTPPHRRELQMIDVDSRRTGYGEVVPPVRVLVADDHRIFAEALTLTLDADHRVEMVGHAENGKEAVQLATTLRPDVVLMDLEMPVLDGI